jgi:hypothetical protein
LFSCGIAGQDHDLPYRIEAWDEQDAHVEELVALVGGRGASCLLVVRRRPGKTITLRQKSRVLAESGKGSPMVRSEDHEDQKDR